MSQHWWSISKSQPISWDPHYVLQTWNVAPHVITRIVAWRRQCPGCDQKHFMQRSGLFTDGVNHKILANCALKTLHVDRVPLLGALECPIHWFEVQFHSREAQCTTEMAPSQKRGAVEGQALLRGHYIGIPTVQQTFGAHLSQYIFRSSSCKV